MEKLSNTPSPLAYSKVIGVTLIITSGDNLPCPLTFFKAASPVVNIGRMPSSKASQTNDDTAWFKCAVVSRKHAKIVFSNSGQVYLVDLCSRHGTYVLKSGEKLCKKLEPESPTPLNDGDIVTFGKVVGRDIGIVRPVTARIKFISRSSPPPTTDRADEYDEFPFTPSPNKSSGRFGVAYTSSSSSSSDIEELGGPESTPNSHIFFENHVEQHLRKHILPPIDFSATRSISRSHSAENHELEEGDTFVMLGDAMSIIGEETEHHFSHHADMSLPPSPAATGPVYMCQANRYNSVFDTDPNVIGAWPGSPVSPISQPDSPRFVWDPVITEEPLDEDDRTHRNGSFQDQERSKDSPVASEEEIKRSQSPCFCGAEDLPSAAAAETKLPSVIKDDKIIVDHASELKEEVSRIRDTVEQVFTDVQLLRYSKRKAASHIHKAEKRLETVDKRLAHVDALCSSHSDTISKITDAEILTIAEREEEIQIKDSALNFLIDELEQMTRKITTEVDALKVAREEALATISTFTAQMAEIQNMNMPSSSPCLKRKRSEDEDVLPDIEAPRRVNKRIRGRLASKILQTAGVFTVGAVATWSALAFS